MYKDKDKQREANRAIQAKRRAKGVTQGVTDSGCDKEGVTKGMTSTQPVIPKAESHVDASDIGAVKTLHRLVQAKSRSLIKGYKQKETEGVTFEEFSKTHIVATVIPVPIEPERTAQGNIRVSKPGDDDYIPQCETTRAFIEGRDKRPSTVKRGKDIKTVFNNGEQSRRLDGDEGLGRTTSIKGASL